jgi:hypothetical protein
MRNGHVFLRMSQFLQDVGLIVNDELARRLWPGVPALGRRIRFGDKPWRTVIGVAGNINGGVVGSSRR